MTWKGATAAYPTMVDGADGAQVPVAQVYAYGKYLGHLTLTFDDAGVFDIGSRREPILLDASVPEDEAIAARVAEMAEPIAALREEVVASTSAPINGDRTSCRAQECEMGNLVADAMLDRVADQGVTIAIQNGGGLRASIDEGEVTMGEVYTVLPFQNVWRPSADRCRCRRRAGERRQPVRGGRRPFRAGGGTEIHRRSCC